MKNPAVKVAGLALAALLLSPIAASADPVVSVSTPSSPVGAVGERGQSVTITGTECVNPDGGAPGYMGEFVALDGDPSSTPGFQWGEILTDQDGNFSTEVTIPIDNGIGAYYARWYCSSAPVTDIDDAHMLWVAPLMTMSIEESSAPQSIMVSKTVAKVTSTKKAVTAAKTTKATAKAPAKASAKAPTASTMPSTGLSVTTDPDALPFIDRIGIPGSEAATLKAQVDAAAFALANPKAAKGKKAPAIRPATNTEYVTAAFDVLTDRSPNNKTIKSYVAELDGGAVKVQVVEEIALTAHKASWWIKHT